MASASAPRYPPQLFVVGAAAEDLSVLRCDRPREVRYCRTAGERVCEHVTAHDWTDRSRLSAEAKNLVASEGHGSVHDPSNLPSRKLQTLR
jgi:hypothetical protein